jgi:hypothetical protein
MELLIAINVTFNAVYTTLFVVLVCGNEKSMIPWYITLIAAIVPALITFLGTYLTLRKSQLSKNSDELKNLSHSISDLANKLGVNNDETFYSEFKRHYNTIIENIGKCIDDKSLTGQHKDIADLLRKEIEVSEQRYVDEERRIRNFTVSQLEVNNKVNDLKLVLESWKRVADENNQKENKIISLENKIADLETQLSQCQDENQSKNRK